MVVTRKREEISNLLIELVSADNKNTLPLPDIKFPTLNGMQQIIIVGRWLLFSTLSISVCVCVLSSGAGKLLEPEESFNEDGEFEEEEDDDDCDAEMVCFFVFVQLELLLCG